MRVLVRGMEMPTSCGTCHLRKSNEDRVWCSILGEYICFETEFLGRKINCPLIEIQSPHGRLIDADALIKELKECMYVANNNWEYEMVTGYSNAIESVEEACTIIEAEGSEDG